VNNVFTASQLSGQMMQVSCNVL